MMRVICSVFIFVVGCSMVQGQSSTIISTLNDIKNFQSSSVTTSSRAYNSLFNEVYGHFFRSQNTLRTARQNVFTAAEKFPYHTLTESRKSLIELLTALTEKHIDPTVDFLQKDSMLKFYNYAKDESTPVEKTLKVIVPQLEELKTAVSKTSNDNCLRRENINRRLPTEYNAIITAINECTRSASMMYRSPINEFTRVHFAALPVITRIGSDLTNCGNNGANRESCVVKFLKTYCVDAADETCKTGSTITLVKTQAETMVNTAQDKYNECLKAAESKIPTATPFIENLSKCVASLREEGGEFIAVDEVIVEESESVNDVV